MNRDTNFFNDLDAVMRQDFGGRGLLASLPPSPLAQVARSLLTARRVILLTGFPVRLGNKRFTGETDGPSGTANLAAGLTACGCTVTVVTDWPSIPLLKAALAFRAPAAILRELPQDGTDSFIRRLLLECRPTHFISLERPGKALDGHCHNMRGGIIDDMMADSSPFLSEARRMKAVTISIGDGGNEMGMGTFRSQILAGVPGGDVICTAEGADFTLASGVSNWWGWGLSAILSMYTHDSGHTADHLFRTDAGTHSPRPGKGSLLLPTAAEETELLRRVVAAGGVDGCTGQPSLSVDALPLNSHLEILSAVRELTISRISQAA